MAVSVALIVVQASDSSSSPISFSLPISIANFFVLHFHPYFLFLLLSLQPTTIISHLNQCSGFPNDFPASFLAHSSILLHIIVNIGSCLIKALQWFPSLIWVNPKFLGEADIACPRPHLTCLLPAPWNYSHFTCYSSRNVLGLVLPWAWVQAELSPWIHFYIYHLIPIHHSEPWKTSLL